MGVLSWAVVVEGSQDFGKCMSKGKFNIPAEKSTRILTFIIFFHSDATGFSCVVGDLGVYMKVTSAFTTTIIGTL